MAIYFKIKNSGYLDTSNIQNGLFGNNIKGLCLEDTNPGSGNTIFYITNISYIKKDGSVEQSEFYNNTYTYRTDMEDTIYLSAINGRKEYYFGLTDLNLDNKNILWYAKSKTMLYGTSKIGIKCNVRCVAKGDTFNFTYYYYFADSSFSRDYTSSYILWSNNTYTFENSTDANCLYSPTRYPVVVSLTAKDTFDKTYVDKQTITINNNTETNTLSWIASPSITNEKYDIYEDGNKIVSNTTNTSYTYTKTGLHSYSIKALGGTTSTEYPYSVKQDTTYTVLENLSGACVKNINYSQTSKSITTGILTSPTLYLSKTESQLLVKWDTVVGATSYTYYYIYKNYNGETVYTSNEINTTNKQTEVINITSNPNSYRYIEFYVKAVNTTYNLNSEYSSTSSTLLGDGAISASLTRNGYLLISTTPIMGATYYKKELINADGEVETVVDANQYASFYINTLTGRYRITAYDSTGTEKIIGEQDYSYSTNSIPNLYVSSATFNSITYSWNINDTTNPVAARKFIVSINDGTNIELSSNTRSYTINNLLTGSYKFKLEELDTNPIFNPSIITISYSITKLNTPYITAKNTSFNSIEFSWDKVENANCYYYSFDNITYNKTTEQSITINNLLSQKYTIYVYAKYEYEDGTGIISDTVSTSSTISKLNSPILSSNKINYNTIQFLWEEVKNANYYYYNLDSSNWKKIDSSILSIEETNLSEGSHSFNIYAVYEYEDGSSITSDTSTIDTSIDEIDAPIINITQTNINQIKVTSYIEDLNNLNVKYYFNIDNGEYEEGNPFYFNNLTIGNHIVKSYIKVPSGNAYINSKIAEKSYTINKLETPTIVKTSTNNGFTWSYNNEFVQGFRVGVSTNGTTYNYETIRFLSSTDRSYVLPIQSSGTYYYKIQAYYILNNNIQSTNYFDSDESNALAFIVTDLDKPIISWKKSKEGLETSILSINKVENADYYDIYVNNNLIYKTTQLEYDGLKDYIGNNIGEYDISVIAKSNLSIYNQSTSDIIKYKVDKIITPVLDYDVSLKKCSWTAVKGSYYTASDYTSYDVYFNDNYYLTTSDTSINLPASITNVSVYVVAYCNTEDAYNPNPLHLASDNSNLIKIGLWPTPYNLRVENGLLLWDIDTDNKPDIYEIYNFGSLYTTTTDNRYEIPSVKENTFIFSIKIPATKYTSASQLSNTIEVHVIKLKTPNITVLTENNKHILTFNPIDGSSYYKLFINGTETKTFSTNRLDITEYVPVGSTDIRVQACSNDLLTINSNLSNIFKLYKSSKYEYYALINNKEERELLLPITISIGADEALDSGSCSFIDTHEDPYETNTDISIRISGDENSTDDIKQFNMIIAGDDVQQVRTNKDIKYLHNITLLGQTKLLDYELMPDISFTQPQSAVELGGKRTVIPNHGNYTIIKDVKRLALTPSVLTLHYKFKTYYEKLANTTIYTQYNIYDSIYLPYISGPIYELSKWLTEYGIRLHTYDTHKFYPTIHYYLREHLSSYEKEPLYPEYEIAQYNYLDDQQAPIIVPSKLNLSGIDLTKGNYDLIVTIDEIYLDDDKYKDYIKHLTGKLAFMYYDENALSKYNWEKWRQLRLVYEDISFVDTEESKINKDAITIHDAVVKVINSIEPLRYSSKLEDKHESAKFILDEDFLYNQDYKNILCPNLQYTGQKTLYEILKDIGREINCVPILNYTSNSNRTISFRKMDNTKDPIVDNNNKLHSSSSAIENNVTGFVSDVKNMITDQRIYQWYPSKNGWITARSTDENSAIINVESCGIVLNKPIYKIKSLKITNFDKYNPELEADITNYLFEKAIYNTLELNNDGIGSALYYSKGDNKIYGIGQTGQVTKLQAILGFSPETYVITNILNNYYDTDKYTDNSLPVKDFKYRIEYIPYSDTQIKLSQFNIYNENNFSYKAYNQSENLVSDEKFGNSLSKQIERLGNTDIGYSYNTDSIFKTDEADTGLAELFDCRIFNNERYYADKIKYTFNNNYISVGINYTKNFNKINDRIGVNSEYRDYEITLNPKANRCLYFNQYCYIDTKEYKNDPQNKIYTNMVDDNWKMQLEEMLMNNINDSSKPSHFWVSFNTFDNQPLQYRSYNNVIKEINYGMIVPTTLLNIRNAIQFNGKMYDNFSAGTYADISIASKSDTGYYGNKDVRYVDSLGRAPVMNISLVPLELSNENSFELPIYGPVWKDPTFKGKSYFNGRYYIDKDSSEALYFNYQMNFHTLNKNIDIHSGLTRYLFNKYDLDSLPDAPHIVAYKCDIKNNSTISNNDIVYDFGPINNNILSHTTRGTLYIKQLVVNVVNRTFECDGYAIIWNFSLLGKSNEILFYVEKPCNGNRYETDNIYFNFLDKQILNNNLNNSEVNN